MSDSKKKEFNETLSELVEFATVSGNKLTKEQIRLYFKDIIDDESKYEFIYSYLTGLKIEIDGVSEKQEVTHDEIIATVETEEAKAFHDMYIKDVKNLKVSEEDRNELLVRVKKGDSQAVNRLAEIYLPMVMEISTDYLNSPLTRSDIVAEGNLALLEAALEYEGAENIDEFEKYIEDRIRKGIEKAIHTELGSNRTSKHLVERINALNDASTELAKELGREAGIEELCKDLSLSEDEVKELMRISINALTVDEGN